MSFGCPNCGRNESLHIIASLELPPDNRSDEITLQAAECVACGFTVVAVYEESRRGALEQEAYNHLGFRVPQVAYQEIKAAIAACGAPRDSTCTCPSHKRFSRQDRAGRWAGLDDLPLGSGFNLVQFANRPPSPG